jgi:hypothetical protein
MKNCRVIAFCIFFATMVGNSYSENSLPRTLTKPTSSSQINVSKIVGEFAQQQMAAFLDRIPQGQEVVYGFTSRSNFLLASAGRPIQMITLDPGQFRLNKVPSVRFLREWRVPVCLSDSWRALLTVANTGGQYEIVALGARELSHELDSYRKIITDPDSEVAILRIFQLSMDFLCVYPASGSPEEGTFYSLMSAKSLKAGQEISYAHLVALLREPMRKQSEF